LDYEVKMKQAILNELLCCQKVVIGIDHGHGHPGPPLIKSTISTDRGHPHKGTEH